MPLAEAAADRAGLEELLSGADDIEVVGSASDGQEAVATAERFHHDVMFCDLSMPVRDGIEASRQILATSPHIRVVILAAFSERDRILVALDGGAIG